MQADGSYYNGGIAKNRFEGFGVLLSANGRERYEGFFRHTADDTADCDATLSQREPLFLCCKPNNWFIF